MYPKGYNPFKDTNNYTLSGINMNQFMVLPTS